VGDNKALPIVGGVLLVLFLPLIIVLALIVGGLAGLSSAEACTPTSTEGKAFAWPTDRHEVDQGWTEPDAEGNGAHSGIDFEVDEGSKVYAAEDGKVVSASGDEVRIRHAEGVETRYKYFKDITVRAKVRDVAALLAAP